MLEENKKALKALGKEKNISAEQAEMLFSYVELLEEWSARTNLVSKKDVSKIVSKHIRESMQFCRDEILTLECRIVDVGSGAGFPGIIIAIFYPDSKVSLVESRKMKSLFLQEVKDQLSLHNVTVINDRAEKLKDWQYYFDVATARAVTSLKMLWSWCSPLLKNDGKLVAQKGGDISNELSALDSRINVSVIPFQFSDPALDRKLIILQKEN